VSTLVRAAADQPRSARDEGSARARGFLVHRARVPFPLGLAAVAALYYGSAKLGYALEFAGPVAAIVWLPVGVAIATLYLAGPRYWPGVLIGDLLANDYSALPLGSAVGQTCGNMLEVLIAAWLLRRLVPGGSPLDSLAGLGRLLVAIVVGTLISATIGTLSLFLGHVVAGSHMPGVWRTWWLGDATGALVVVPLVLAWHRWPPAGWLRGRELEAAVLFVSVVGLGELALRSHRPLTYLIFPPLIWAALRFGQRGATVGIAIAVSLAVWNTTHYFGPFAFESITRMILSTQLFIAAASLTTLALAAAMSEREALASGLRASRARLVEATDAERRRLEQDLHDGAQQRLTALTFRLRRSGERVAQAPEDAPSLFAEAEAELARAIDELRELAHGISPVSLAGGGLASAIASVSARSALPIRVLDVVTAPLNPTVEATAFYLVAETVTNAHRYSGATSVTVRAVAARGALVVEVADDGVGGAAERPGSGLQGLRDRVEAIGGSFSVRSPRGGGTRVAAAIPLVEPAV
jgi:signal transduction histidine kinase